MTSVSGCGVDSSLLSWDESQSPLVDEAPGRGSSTIEFLLEHLSLGRWGVQRKPRIGLAVFQVPTAQNNQHTKVAYLGLAYSAALQKEDGRKERRGNKEGGRVDGGKKERNLKPVVPGRRG